VRACLVAVILFSMTLIPLPGYSTSPTAEKTYSITLTKKAEAEHNIYEIGGRKVLTDLHEVKEGEYLWKIMRDKGLLDRPDFPALFKALKQLNSSFKNLDLIHPGDKILIPLKIAPLQEILPSFASSQEKKLPLAELKDINFEQYTVAPGDNIVKVVTEKYNIPARELYGRYMEMLKKLNPYIKDVNRIYPGQVIKLPIFTPKVVRKPIYPSPKQTLPEVKEKVEEEEAGPLNPFAQDLRAIFVNMGEEWIQDGEHFIPLRSGGQIDLKASSFPLISTVSGIKVIVDLGNRLPQKIASLIEGTWGNYRIIHLLPSDDLTTSLDKILAVCNYTKVLSKGQGVTIGKDIIIHLRGDWVVERGVSDSSDGWNMVVINILNDPAERTNPWLVRFLEGLGIRVIDHPHPLPGQQPPTTEAQINITTLNALTRTLLYKLGIKFSTDVDIPVYGKKLTDFNLIIKADFFFRNKGADTILDLGSLDGTLVSFLEEHRFKVLSLSGEKDLLEVTKKILGFLGAPYKGGAHEFWGSQRDARRNIKIEILGISFLDLQGQKVLVTLSTITPELATFLYSRGYKAISLAPNPTP